MEMTEKYIDWIFIYNFDYINIPNTWFFSKCYYIFVSFIFLNPFILIFLGILINKDKMIKFRKILLIYIAFIIILNITIFTYNRRETLSFSKYYITQKEEINGKYYIYTNNESKLICEKSIYNSAMPGKEYILAFRSNKLILYKKIVSITENE
jgi:hypothetical protein